MKLSLLSLLLGLGIGLPQIYGLARPAAFAEALRKFPRSLTWGYLLMPLGTAWFLWNLKSDQISDFDAFKPILFAGFAIIGIGTCVFVRDFLAVRGLAVVVLLLAKLVLDSARWVDSEWRLVLAVGAYVWIVLAVWFTISPWRLRDFIGFLTANATRVRLGCVLRLGLALLLIGLGLTVFRQACGGFY
jgi:hypothetical protein